MQSLVDIELTTIQIRLQAIKDAILRSRNVFVVSTIGSVAILTCCWNAYLSWYRIFLLQENLPANSITQLAQKAIIDRWTESLWISLAPLGIRIGISDISVIGCLGILVISIWFFFAVRRENHAVGSLLDDAFNSPSEIKELILHSITSNLIFVNRKDDRPHGIRRKSENSEEFVGLRILLNAVFFLPAIAAWASILADVLSLFLLDAPFRMPHQPLLLGHVLKSGELPKLLIMMAIAVAMAYFITKSSVRIYAYENDIERMLDEFQKHLAIDSPKIALETGLLKDEAERRQTWLVDSLLVPNKGTSPVSS